MSEQKETYITNATPKPDRFVIEPVLFDDQPHFNHYRIRDLHCRQRIVSVHFTRLDADIFLQFLNTGRDARQHLTQAFEIVVALPTNDPSLN